ncbi:hypothetical protein AU210_011956 [Fusarium oxysporum f. sp. radicis-cucumerinum]|uniref:Uncharacterized protein n=1 Tax=Fusarium oxysporum f. sp. radicis-cucumerinum TaxID=327505 RepID=A0A2H3GWW5_FUSOX|nr:hypothetical protein AU210_011956 [Fusarium oxysporum f. sp. radicis-cucumerinum]
MSYHSRNASGSSHSSLLRLPSPIELDENHTFSKASLYPLDHTDYEPCRKRIINASFGARQVIRFINHLETHNPVQHDAAVKRLIEIGVDVDDLVRLSKRRAEVPWEETWPYNWEKKEGLVLGYMKRNLPRWIAIMKKTEAREAAEAMGETLEDDDSDDYITADEMAETEATQEDEVRPREEVEDGVDIEQTKDSTAKDEDIHAEASSPKTGHSMGVIGTYDLLTRLYDLPDGKYTIVRTFTEELGLTVAFVGKMKESAAELIPNVERVVKNGTLGFAIGEGPFSRELARLNDENGLVMVGSSANLTDQGQKFRVEDIEPEIIKAADLVVNYGRQKWHLYGRAGTILDLDNERVLRIGANYENIREKLIDLFGWAVPEDLDYDMTGKKTVGFSIKTSSDSRNL